MLVHLIAWSLRQRALVLLAAVALLVLGLGTGARLPVDVFPDLNRPTVVLLTNCGGLAPEEVEVLVTRPLELAMAGQPGVQRVRSQSAAGLSVVWVELDWAVPAALARQQVTERLAAASQDLPEGILPFLTPVSSIMGEILLIGITSPDGTVPGPELRTLTDWTLRPRLMSIPGISQAAAIGGGVEQLQVQLHPERLAALGIPLHEAVSAAASAQANTSGGFLDRQGQEYVVRNLASTSSPEAIAATVITRRGGIPVTLGEVADVGRGIGTMRGDASVDARPSVILTVQKQPGVDTVALTRQVEQALDELRPALPPGVQLVTLFRQADFIEASIHNVQEALRDGALLVALVLLLFLHSARTALISLTAIPLSFAAALLALQALGLTINTMTLGGLAIAIGELVDDAIVDVENVWRRLRENAAQPQPLPAIRVVLLASAEVRGAIVFSTILVLLVFLPLLGMSGIEGRMFAPLGIAYLTSISASLLVSLTVTPVLASWLLTGAAGPPDDGWLVTRLKRAHRRVLHAVLPRPAPVIAATAALVIAALAAIPGLGTSFLPPFHEGTATINLLARPGTSLPASNALATTAEELLLTIPEVSQVGRRVGRAEQDEHAEGVHYIELDVDFHPEGRPRDEVLDEVRHKLSLLPGVGVGVGQPISHRLDHMMSGVRAQIAVKVFGPELDTLRDLAAQVADTLRGVDGLVDLQIEAQALTPQLRLQVNREAAAHHGLPPGSLTADLQQALEGEVVGQVIQESRTTDIVARLAPEARTDADLLATLPWTLPDGPSVPLGDLARISVGSGPNQILHEAGQRRIVISANTADRDLGAVVADVEDRLRQLPRPVGYHLEVGGQHESQRSASRTLLGLGLLSLAAMYTVLYSHFGSHRLVLQVLLNIPLALVGAVAAIAWSGQPLSVAGAVGFVTLCGISSRNSILLLSHYAHLQHQEGMAPGPDLVIRGSLERLVPVTMTALCAGIGLLPLALAGPVPGKEILTPIAQVILGGLASSTLLDLIVTPTLFLRYAPTGAHAPDALEGAP